MSANPFQPPEPSKHAESSYVYRPLRVLTVVVAVALLLDVLFLFATAASTRLLVAHDPGVLAGNDPIDERSLVLGAVMLLSSVGYLLAYLGGGIFFCAWLVRASKNARALGARGMEFTPGWTAGWFFVPVMNLFRPYEAVKELYQASDPESGESDWAAFEPPGFILSWWVSWIAFTVVGTAAQNFWTLPFVTVMLAVVSAPLAVRVLLAIERRQTQKRRRGPQLSVAGEAEVLSSNRFL